MSTIVCQNIVSCFESQLTETTTTLKLKVAAPPPPATLQNLGISRDNRPQAAEVKTNTEFGSWGFLQTTPKETGDSYTYTHPSSKTTPFSRLSPKSLQLCTENLGSETGSDIITDTCTIFSSSPPPFTTPSPNSDQISVCRNRAESDYCNNQRTTTTTTTSTKKPNSRREIKNFPPPLTSMSGSGSMQVRHHREGGRLIIEAVEAPFRNSYLQAERSDGRLRLCFLTAAGGEQEHDDDDDEEEEQQEQGEECGEEMAAAEAEETEEEAVSEIESENEESDEGINLEMEKFQWLRRCNEGGHGNKGLCSSWKPALWVATS